VDLRLLFPVLATLGTLACNSGASSSDRAGPTLTVLGVPVVLRDDTGPPLARPVTLSRRTGDGAFLISDLQSNTVFAYTSRGDRLGSLGRKGRGPGELEGPAAIVQTQDSVIGVYGMGLRAITLYAASTGAYLRRVSLPGYPSYYAPSEFRDTVWLGARDLATGHSVVVWVPSTDAVTQAFPLPAEYSRYGEAMRFSGTPLAIAGDTLVLGFSPFDPLLVLDRHLGTADTIDVPHRLRRGTSLQVFQDQTTDFDALLTSVSSIEALGFLPSHLLAVVHADKHRAEAPHGGLQADLFVSLLDLTVLRGCIDQPVPIMADAVPIVRLRADTLFVLTQQVQDTQVVSTVTSFRLEATRCRWQPLRRVHAFLH
jgi:hypothetical protein